MALQPDGKILVAGATRIGTQFQYAVLRYLTNGSPDNSFGTQGQTMIPFNTGGGPNNRRSREKAQEAQNPTYSLPI